jgi:tRNA threonylcarbamoyladenosine biosynthesis protein TsaE
VIQFPAIDETELGRIAARLVPTLAAGAVVHLSGPLGAGKTSFARALMHALGVHARIKSPTYSLIESYDAGELEILHIDLYRIAAAEEVAWLGLSDYAGAGRLWLIEWPERAPGVIPPPDLVVRLEHAGLRRDLSIEAATVLGKRGLEHMVRYSTA